MRHPFPHAQETRDYLRRRSKTQFALKAKYGTSRESKMAVLDIKESYYLVHIQFCIEQAMECGYDLLAHKWISPQIAEQASEEDRCAAWMISKVHAMDRAMLSSLRKARDIAEDFGCNRIDATYDTYFRLYANLPGLVYASTVNDPTVPPDIREHSLLALAGWCAERTNVTKNSRLKRALESDGKSARDRLLEELPSALLTASKDGTVPELLTEVLKYIEAELRPAGLSYEEFVSKGVEPSVEDSHLRGFFERENFREVLECAHLSAQERDIIEALRDEPDLLDYGGRKELAARLGRPESQIGAEKSNASKKLRNAYSELMRRSG